MKPSFLLLCFTTSLASEWRDFHPELLPYHIASDKNLRELCNEDKECPVKLSNTSDLCWGHEPECRPEKSYSFHNKLGNCEKKHENNINRFFDQADFGYLKERSQMTSICSSKEEAGTFLECSPQMRFCRGRNFFFDFKSFKTAGSQRYRNDIIHEGEVGGKCDVVNEDWLKENQQHKSYLQSWAHELEFFKSNDDFSMDSCDIVFDRPTWIIKLDAAVNMYHHFCDFVNLYASHHINGTFDLDIDIILWETHSSGFDDLYFGVTWKAFTRREPIQMKSLAGKRVCFKDAALSLLARQRYGLFYNMPMALGCSGSGLIHAFARHVLHRLGIYQEGPSLDVIRITILSRGTQYRKILNINELAVAIKGIEGVDVKIVDYNRHVPFERQLQITQNTDVFIGMHGSGLTHLLFLPDWAAVFEIYNCEDSGCYLDLARLRGVKYFTWPEDKLNLIHPQSEGKSPTSGEAHKKFTNYSFDVKEFKKIVKKMVEWVRRSPNFVEARRKLRRRKMDEL